VHTRGRESGPEGASLSRSWDGRMSLPGFTPGPRKALFESPVPAPTISRTDSYTDPIGDITDSSVPTVFERLPDSLRDPSAYPHAPDTIEIVQTHISYVALVPPRVYKIKKPLDLGFLDFRSLADRRHFCEREVRLNRRLCRNVYEGVVPIVRTEDGLKIDPDDASFDDDGDGAEGLVAVPSSGEDAVEEWAVRMRYMEPAQFLNRRIETDRVPSDAIDRLTDALCSFYTEQDPSPEVAEAGWIDRIRVSFDENFDQTRDLVGRALSRPAFEALQFYVDRFFDAHASLFHRRRAERHFVDGHGDLRLEHVHMTDDRVCIYDCIEFNERFRHIDVANDVAFLAMDFDAHARPGLGRQFVHAVADRLDDPDLPTLIPFYKSYRAYVRGKVHSMRAAEAEVPASERTASRATARVHYQNALQYAVAGESPLVVVVMGRSGTGKSTQATALAEALGWAHLSSDRIRKTRAGVPLHIRPSAETRAWLYSDEMSRATYATLRDRALDRARTQRSTVLDATYSSRSQRDALRRSLRDANVPYAFVELVAADDVLKQRLSRRDEGTATVSDARAEDFDLLSSRYETPTALEDARHFRVPTGGGVHHTTTNILRSLIRFNL